MAFAAELLAAASAEPDRVRRLARDGQHADVVVVEREGASISVDAAREVISRAHRSPVEADRQVLILVDFHLVRDAGPILLKTIEEPPPATIFVILADEVPAELITIASRCVLVPFRPLSAAVIAEALEGDGESPERAVLLATQAGGDLRRARILARDPDVESRAARWRSVPDELDGTGYAVCRVVDDLLSVTDSVADPYEAAYQAEIEEMTHRLQALDPDAEFAVPKSMAERHKRELRRARTDELRSGLRTLADRLRADVVADSGSGAVIGRSLRRIGEASAALARNPNERLLLQDLLGGLSRARSG